MTRCADHTDGAPAKNHSAMTASKIMHPHDDVGSHGQSVLPQKWCAKSQHECRIHATPIHRNESSAL